MVMKLLEDQETPTILFLTAPEWHAIFGGLRSGFRVWNRKQTQKSDIEKMDIPDGLKKDYLDKYQYYVFAEDVPEFGTLIFLAAWFVHTGQINVLAKMAGGIMGIPL